MLNVAARPAFDAYPRFWNLRQPDPNVDHRRVPNLMTFFQRRGKGRPLLGKYAAGDVVAWQLPNGLAHIGVVAEQLVKSGTHHLVVHNIGEGARIEDVLHAYQIVGHYRW